MKYAIREAKTEELIITVNHKESADALLKKFENDAKTLNSGHRYTLNSYNCDCDANSICFTCSDSHPAYKRGNQ